MVLCGREGTRLWQQLDGGAWAPPDVAHGAPCDAGAVFDADHDGDLDIFVTGPAGSELLNNNRDGSFRPLAGEMGISGGAGRQVLAADLDSDRDLDILVLNTEPPHDVWQNDRTWRYQPFPGLDDLAACIACCGYRRGHGRGWQDWKSTASPRTGRCSPGVPAMLPGTRSRSSVPKRPPGRWNLP